MAVHLPLSNEAVLEAQMLMLASHNILNPANGAPITVPSQDMVLGLYYITKLRKGAKGEGLTFYGPEEATIAYNEGKVDIHAIINVVVKDLDENGNIVDVLMKETSVGRVIVNEIVPAEVGYINRIISKKSLREIIGDVIKVCGVAKTADFLDGIKNLGYRMAFQGGLSFNLDDIIIPKEKQTLVQRGYDEVEQVVNNYNMLVLGIIVALFFVLHLAQFWFKMQFVELSGLESINPTPQDGAALISQTFANPLFAVLYLVWFVAIWFHLTHGFWSALQTLGWSNKIWFERWKCISNIFATVIFLGFALVVVVFYVKYGLLG